MGRVRKTFYDVLKFIFKILRVDIMKIITAVNYFHKTHSEYASGFEYARVSEYNRVLNMPQALTMPGL